MSTDLFVENTLILNPTVDELGEGGEILLQGATGYNGWSLDVRFDIFRIFNSAIVYEFRTDGIYLHGEKITLS